MKRIIVCCLLLLCSSLVFSQDFRNVTWGMTQTDVMVVEKSTLSKREPTYLVYNVPIEDIMWQLYYSFHYGKLLGAVYTMEFNNNLLARKEYKNILNILIDKYGKPHTELYSDHHAYQHFGTAIWELDRIIIKIEGYLPTESWEGLITITYCPSEKIFNEILNEAKKETF